MAASINRAASIDTHGNERIRPSGEPLRPFTCVNSHPCQRSSSRCTLEDTLRAFDALNQVPELLRRFLSQYLAYAFEGVDQAIESCKQSVYVEDEFAVR